jgi:predicted N-formylglutamate amidohydrolase
VPPALLSVHSFTESWKEHARPWHAGVLWGADARLARPLIEAFHAEGDLIVGENEPYEGQLVGDCLWQHGAQRGLANAIVEIRQDLIRDAACQAAWTERLCRIVANILGDTAPAPQAAAREGPSPVPNGRMAPPPQLSTETAT